MLTDLEFAKVKQTFDYVHSIFEHIDDGILWTKPEQWEDPKYVAHKLEAERLQGDCDEFALACRFLLTQARVPNRIAYVETENGRPHLVCEADGWILDSRQLRVRSWGELPYKWLRISGYRVGEPWQEVTA